MPFHFNHFFEIGHPTLGGSMGKKLFVGNLSYSTSEQSLSDAFSQYGVVESVKIITDHETGRSKGFGFVEMSSDSEAQESIESLNGSSLGDRNIVVNESRPMAPRGDRDSFSRGSNNRGDRGGNSSNRW